MDDGLGEALGDEGDLGEGDLGGLGDLGEGLGNEGNLGETVGGNLGETLGGTLVLAVFLAICFK